MAGIITTGSNPHALWPGMQAFWGTYYDEHPLEHMELFDEFKSNKAYEETTGLIGFGLAPIKEQGSSVQYDSQSEGATNRYTNITYALGFIVTHEEQKDNLYLDDMMFDRTRMLAFSMRTTKEIVGANIYNRAFNSSFTFGDGVELIANNHDTGDGTQSNILAVAADISEASLEDMAIQINNATDTRGLQIAIRPRKVIIPTALEFDTCRILKSVLQNDTANNAVNALAAVGAYEGYTVNHYLTDTDAWFVRTTAPKGMKYFNREDRTLSEDNDFDTVNYKIKQMERYSFGADDFRGIYGSPGA